MKTGKKGRVLNDEELVMVSGGMGERPQEYERCPYCHVSHAIVKEYPWTVKVRGNNYSNATKCICSSRAGIRVFYMVVLDTGEEVYVDDRMTHPRKATSI